MLSVGRTNPQIDAVAHLDWDLTRSVPDTVLDRAHRVRTVIHCAAHVDIWGTAETFHDVNVAGTRRALDVFRQARFIHMSSTDVYDPRAEHSSLYEEAGPVSQDRYVENYGRTKAQAEAVIQRVRPQSVLLRPAPAYGDGDRHNFPFFARRIRNGVLRLPTAASRTISLTHVDNIVAATLGALSHTQASGPINVADPQPYELLSALNTYMARTGQPSVRFETQPSDLAMFKAWMGEKRAHIMGRRPDMTRAVIARLSRDRSYDLTRLRSVLEVEPEQRLAPR